jgi:hypothetical protein
MRIDGAEILEEDVVRMMERVTAAACLDHVLRTGDRLDLASPCGRPVIISACHADALAVIRRQTDSRRCAVAGGSRVPIREASLQD